MKWIKKFENIEDQIPDRFDEDKIDEYFQELIDTWDVEIEYDDELYGDVYSDVLAIVIEVGKDLHTKFPTFEGNHKIVQSRIGYSTIDEYFRFMSDLKKCIDHLVSSSEGDYTCNEIIQDEYSITILIE